MMINVLGKQMPGRIATRRADPEWGGRESKAITVAMTYDEAVETFVDDVDWSVTYDVTGDDGAVHQENVDMSMYAISGPITDNRDGTITIRMGKYRDEELMSTALEAIPDSHQQAQVWRGVIEQALQCIEDDQAALAAAPLYPVWCMLVPGTELTAGMRIYHDGKLYRVITTHAVSADWEPGKGTESLYTRIDEVHSGSKDDPIPYEGNMALVNGLYYSQGGVVYLCVRDTVNPVHHALADLVGLYVEVVA